MKISVSKSIQEFIRKMKSVIENNKITFIIIIPSLFIETYFAESKVKCVWLYHQYGMTPERYLGIMLLIFEIVTLVIRHFWIGQYEKLLPFLGLLVMEKCFQNLHMGG